jgi:hypothetical protein
MLGLERGLEYLSQLLLVFDHEDAHSMYVIGFT